MLLGKITLTLGPYCQQSKAGRERKETVKILDNSQKLAKELLAMSEYPVNRETSFNLPQHFPKLAELASCNLILPLQSSVTVNLPANNIALPDHRPFPSDLPYIAGKAWREGLADSVFVRLLSTFRMRARVYRLPAPDRHYAIAPEATKTHHSGQRRAAVSIFVQA